MKLRKIFAVLSATALAASCMAISASAATKLPDVCHPDEENADMNDAYYSIGAMGYFMNQTWKWNQGDWIGIDDDGVIDMEYHISQVAADTTLEGKGTLGDMGIMVCNLPEDSYPYEITVTDATFTDEDGNVTTFDSILSMTEAEADVESGFRIHIRPTDETDDDGNVVPGKAARPEVAGWDEEGKFNGGTLHIRIDFGKYEPETEDSSEASDESTSDDSASDSKGDKDSKTDSDASKSDSSSSKSDSSSKGNGGGGNGGGGNGGGKTAAATGDSAADGEAKSDATESSDTGAAQGVALAVIALAGAGIVVAKKKH